MNELAQALEAASAVFGRVPSITVCSNAYTMIVDGRLFRWSNERGLRMLLPVPQHNGQINMVEVPEALTTRDCLNNAIRAADKLFRREASGQMTHAVWGFELEDLFVAVAERLGFANVVRAQSGDRFTVRHSTPREDGEDKFDVVLTVPAASSNTAVTTIPIQLTTNTRARKKTKDLRGRDLVFINMNRFRPRAEQQDCVRAAAKGDRLELWFMSQIFKGAIRAYTGCNLTLQVEPAFGPADIKSHVFLQFKKLLAKDVLEKVKEIIMGLRQPASRKQSQIVAYLQELWREGHPLIRTDLYRI